MDVCLHEIEWYFNFGRQLEVHHHIIYFFIIITRVSQRYFTHCKCIAQIYIYIHINTPSTKRQDRKLVNSIKASYWASITS